MPGKKPAVAPIFNTEKPDFFFIREFIWLSHWRRKFFLQIIASERMFSLNKANGLYPVILLSFRSLSFCVPHSLSHFVRSTSFVVHLIIGTNVDNTMWTGNCNNSEHSITKLFGIDHRNIEDLEVLPSDVCISLRQLRTSFASRNFCPISTSAANSTNFYIWRWNELPEVCS